MFRFAQQDSKHQNSQNLVLEILINSENGDNFINLERSRGEESETLKRQLASIWLSIWLNHFELDIVWPTCQMFLLQYWHISALRCFWRISAIFMFLFLGKELKTKTPKPPKIINFDSIEFKCLWILFLDRDLNFSSVSTEINKTDSI